jgi:hypothetical protein
MKVSNKVGCIGDRSVPMTTAAGCASAKQRQNLSAFIHVNATDQIQ